MATKDWERVKGFNAWVKYTPRGLKGVRYDYDPRGIASTPNHITISSRTSAGKTTSFKTKTAALAFARAYMRKH